MSKAKNFEIAFKLGSKLDPSVKRNFETASKQIGNMQQKIGQAVKTGAKFAVGFVGAATAVAGSATLMANKFAATGDRIDKLSQKIGLSRQAFQEWEFILSQSGTDIEKMQTGLKTLNQRMDETMRGTGKGAEYFNRLGVSVKDTEGNLRNQEAVFEDTVRALQEIPDGAEKARLATELFGRAGQELMPLLNGAAGSVDEMKKKAHDLGIVIGDDAVDGAILWTDTMDQAKRALGGLFNTVAASALPKMQKFLDYGITKLPVLREKITKGMDLAGKAFDYLGDKGTKAFNAVRDAIRNNQPTIESLKQIGIDLGDVLKSGFENAKPYIAWLGNVGVPKARDILIALLNKGIDFYNLIKNNWSTIKPIVTGAVIVLGSLKAAMLAMSIAQTVTGLLKGFKVATAAARLSMLGLNGAMLANPMTWLVAAILAAIAVGVLLWKNWDTVKEKGVAAWEALKNGVRGPANALIGIANGVIGAFEGMLNGVGNAINKIPSIKIPDWVPKFGGSEFGIPNIPTINLPKIPALAKGGITTGATLAMIGEGAEQEAVLPLSKLEALLNPKNNTTNNESSEQIIHVSYSPHYHLPRGANKEEVEGVTKQGYNEFKRWIKRYEAENKRLKFS